MVSESYLTQFPINRMRIIQPNWLHECTSYTSRVCLDMFYILLPTGGNIIMVMH